MTLAALALPLAPAAATAGTETPAASDPSEPVLVMPGLEWIDEVIVTDDAIYATGDCTPGGCLLLTRSLDVTDDTVTLGAPELLGRHEGRLAEHEGTVAYWRSYDRRLVFRAPDGTELTPGWGAAPAYASGLDQISDQWILQGDWLAERSTGHGRTLIPDGQDGTTRWYWQHVLAGEDLLVSVIGSTLPTENVIVARPLGTDGPSGDGVVVDTWRTEEAPAAAWRKLRMLGMAGDSLVWQTDSQAAVEPPGSFRWNSAPPYGDAYSELVVDPSYLTPYFPGMVDRTGTWLVIGRDVGTDGFELTWLDVSGETAVTQRTALIDTSTTAPRFHDVRDSLVAYGLGSDVVLVDAEGREIVADQTPVQVAPWFSDVSWSNGFAPDIAWLVDFGITGGYTDGSFRPNRTVTRGQMAAFLYRLAGEPAVDASGGADFSDIPADHAFAEAITWLVDQEITGGYTDGTFRPDRSVTRGQMAAFLARFSGEEPAAVTTARFTDVPADHPFAAEIAWLARNAITGGYADGTFRPTAPIARQHMAAFLNRFHYHHAGLVPGAVVDHEGETP